MNPLWGVLAAPFCALAAGGLVYFVMQSRMEVRLARQREKLAAADAALGARKEAMADSLHGAVESARREAMDEFLADIHVEERHYIRQYKTFFLTRKCLVRQERIFFRNLPLSNWFEQEMPLEEGADIQQLANSMTIFGSDGQPADADPRPVKLTCRSRA
jgi:hypothetical protein